MMMMMMVRAHELHIRSLRRSLQAFDNK